MRGECFLLLLPAVRTFAPDGLIVWHGQRRMRDCLVVIVREWELSGLHLTPLPVKISHVLGPGVHNKPAENRRKQTFSSCPWYPAPPGGLAYQSIFHGPQQSRLGAIEWVGGRNSVHCHRRFNFHFFPWMIFRFVFVSVKKKLTLVESLDSRDFEGFYCRCSYRDCDGNDRAAAASEWQAKNLSEFFFESFFSLSFSSRDGFSLFLGDK